MNNFYEILEVSEKASVEVIDRAYRVLAKKYHPDVQVDNKKESEEKMKQINEAYETLINPAKREEYDKKLEKDRTKEQNKIEKQEINQENQQKQNTSTNMKYTVVTKPTEYKVTNTSEKEEKKELRRQKRIKRKLEKETQRRYLEAYDDYLISKGYRIRYRWTLKKIIQILLTIILTIFALYILWLIPSIRDTLTNLYMENNIIKFIVDTIIKVLNSIYVLILNLLT